MGRELNEKLDPLNSKYYYPNDTFEAIINDPTSIAPYAFGHSETLANLNYGYWQNIFTYRYIGHTSQVLIGSNGKSAIKYYSFDDNYDSGWQHLISESEIEWKGKPLNQTVDTIRTDKVIAIPEIAGARECLFTVGSTMPYTYRQCLIISIGQSAGFMYISPHNGNEYFFGHLERTQTGVILNIYGIGMIDLSNVKLIDVLYR